MNDKVPPTEAHHQWVAHTLGVDPRKHESAKAPADPGARDGGPAAQGKKTGPTPNPASQAGPLVLDLQVKGVRKVKRDPDDPFSDDIEVPDFEMPPVQEPMPKVRPHNDVIIKYLQDIPEFASGRAVSYCQAVAEACAEFEKYTKHRIKEITKPSFGAEEMFGALVSVVATITTGGLGGEALEGMAKLIAEGVKDAIKDTMKDQGAKGFKKASGNESKAEELEEMAEALAAEAKQRADNIKNAVQTNVSAAMDPLINKLLNKGKLTKNEDEFILPFAAADSAGKDRLYRNMGVPDLAAAKSVKLNLFGQLTWRFEDQVWEDKGKDDIDRGKKMLADANTEEEKAKAQEYIEFYENQAKQNARATAHNAWGKYATEMGKFKDTW